MINFPLSVWSPTSFQIVSHLRPSPVENFYYRSGSPKPNMLVKRENVLVGRRRRLLTERMWFDQSTLCRRASRAAGKISRGARSGAHRKTLSLLRGTEGSNPPPSSGESIANSPLRSNVSYNVKKMVGNGYLTQQRSLHDRRSIHVSLTEKIPARCMTR